MSGQQNYGILYGPEWAAAVEFGIDVSLLESNLRLTPAERLRELVAMNHLHEQIQSRTLTPEDRERLAAMELEEKLAGLGVSMDEVL